MTTLPNPFIQFAEVKPSSAISAAAPSPPASQDGAAASNSRSALEAAMPAESAAGPVLADSRDPAADQFQSPMAMEVIEEAPAVPPNTIAGATDHIHEIFHFARKLAADDHRFVLDEAAFMDAIEPPPLFLQHIA